MAIYIDNAFQAFVNLDSIINAANRALQEEKYPTADVSVVLSNDETLRDLNLKYRGFDKPTDVLSFAQLDVLEGSPTLPHTGDIPIQLGDVIISMQQCALNAAKAHHTEDDELALLVVHGTLHLVGYDHMTKSDKTQMWLKQKRALKAIQLSPRLRLPG